MVPEWDPRNKESKDSCTKETRTVVTRLAIVWGSMIPERVFLFIGGILYKASCKTGIIGLITGLIPNMEIGRLDQIAFKQFQK